MNNLFTLFVLIFSIEKCFCKFQCLDQNGKPVDWYVVYKHPKLFNSNDLLSRGESYMYLTSETVDRGWTWSSIGIQDSNTLLANTLKPFYNETNQGLWIMYNDQNPKHEWIWVIHGGHTKGVVGADSNGGIWLVHSVPKYPPAASKGYKYPKNGYKHGQSALCITLTPQSLNEVGKALSYNDPEIYEKRMPSSLQDIYPNLFSAVNKELEVKTPWYIKSELKTPKETTFIVYAKDKRFNKDIYELIASDSQSDLLVETWRVVISPMSSSCSNTFKVMNIDEIAMKEANIYYTSNVDHSKWAVATSAPLICIGDINRTTHQMKRGGGSVCFRNEKLWKLYNATIDHYNGCN